MRPPREQWRTARLGIGRLPTNRRPFPMVCRISPLDDRGTWLHCYDAERRDRRDSRNRPQDGQWLRPLMVDVQVAWHLTRIAVSTHARDVRSLLRGVASLACLLVFAQNVVAACAGWQATPEARVQCCQDSACPLHHHQEASPTKAAQAAADKCCAQSTRQDSSQSPSAFASTMTLASLKSIPSVAVNQVLATPLSTPWETAAPPTHVPKHLLLSVLLV